MIRNATFAAVLVPLLLTPVQGIAGVKVRFIHPERYTDAGSFGAASRDSTMAELRTYFKKLGDLFLAPGQNLVIEVENIDLAGEYEPWRSSFSDVRVLRGITPPGIRFRYVLSERGRRLRSGEADLTDISYQTNMSARTSTDRYAYEKALLTDWFERNFPRSRDQKPQRR